MNTQAGRLRYKLVGMADWNLYFSLFYKIQKCAKGKFVSYTVFRSIFINFSKLLVVSSGLAGRKDLINGGLYGERNQAMSNSKDSVYFSQVEKKFFLLLFQNDF